MASRSRIKNRFKKGEQLVRLVRPLRRRGTTTSRPNPGTAPGQLRMSPDSHPTRIYVVAYGPDGYIQHECKHWEEVQQFLTVWPVVWVNVIGLADVEAVEKLGTLFGIDRLLLEDVLDTSHRSKVEFYENYVFTILRGGVFTEQFETEQLSLFLKKNVALVFQERPSHNFEQVRERIRRGTGKIRSMGPDYLYYALLDEVIDRYFPVLDSFNMQLSSMEDEIVTSSQTQPDIIQRIHHAKSDLLLLHRTVWPISDIIGMLMREETPLISKETRAFLRDCFDHGLQANELTQFYRDTATGLLNTFLAYEGHKTNEIVKVLTMVSAVFIPLNLIAGVYGMNFAHMPELQWAFGYEFALGLMTCIAAIMLVFFKRRGWLNWS